MMLSIIIIWGFPLVFPEPRREVSKIPGLLLPDASLPLLHAVLYDTKYLLLAKKDQVENSFPWGSSWYSTVNNAPQKTLRLISATIARKKSTHCFPTSSRQRVAPRFSSYVLYMYIFEEEILNATQYANPLPHSNVFFCSFPKRTFFSRISENMGYTYWLLRAVSPPLGFPLSKFADI